ncbi:hypothetical protein LP419_06160 [Massilia sp. H-1]|nr:hypothetical protein LP419_06160 [Massilia sp. H-1]
MNGESIPGPENEYNYMREMLPSITLGEMNRYARETIPTDASKLIAYMGAANSETIYTHQRAAAGGICRGRKNHGQRATTRPLPPA